MNLRDTFDRIENAALDLIQAANDLVTHHPAGSLESRAACDLMQGLPRINKALARLDRKAKCYAPSGK